MFLPKPPVIPKAIIPMMTLTIIFLITIPLHTEVSILDEVVLVLMLLTCVAIQGICALAVWQSRIHAESKKITVDQLMAKYKVHKRDPRCRHRAPEEPNILHALI